MKKFFSGNKYAKPCVCVFFLAVALIIFEKTAGNLNSVFSGISGILKAASGTLAPFLYGFSIAYVANAVVRPLEAALGRIPNFKNARARRAVSIALTFVATALLVTLIIAYMVPEIVNSLKKLSDIVYSYINTAQNDVPATAATEQISSFFAGIASWLDSFFETINHIFSTDLSSQTVADALVKEANKINVAVPGIAERVFSGAIGFAGTAFNAFLGIFIAFYMLMEKEYYSRVAAKTARAVMKKNSAESFLETAKTANKIFENFIIGKSLDALITGVIFFVVAVAFRLPYPLLLGAIMAIANMIPFFGPFIGGVPVVIIVLLSDLGALEKGAGFSLYPTVTAAVSLVVIQQLDGNIIAPKILGASTGLKPLEVIFSVIIGGALFGVPGLFFGTPALAVIKVLFKALIDRKYARKQSAEIETPAPDEGSINK